MSTATETIVLYVSKPELAAAQANLAAAADRLTLRLSDVVESAKLLSVKLMLTVTGEPGQIETFRAMFEGDGWQSGGGETLVDFLLTPIINGGMGTLQRKLARRRRMKRHQAASERGDE